MDTSLCEVGKMELVENGYKFQITVILGYKSEKGELFDNKKLKTWHLLSIECDSLDFKLSKEVESEELEQEIENFKEKAKEVSNPKKEEEKSVERLTLSHLGFKFD